MSSFLFYVGLIVLGVLVLSAVLGVIDASTCGAIEQAIGYCVGV